MRAALIAASFAAVCARLNGQSSAAGLTNIPGAARAWPPLPVRARLASPSSPSVSWQTLTNTYLAAGSDLTNGSMTVAEAEGACAADARCLGFTYDSAAAPGPAYNVLLKYAISTGAGAGWVAYVKEAPRILSGSFSSSAVIQHDAPCLWGWGANVTGARVTVATDADGGAAHATAVLANNTWRLCLPAMAPGGPWTVNATVEGLGSQVLADVLFGEVWVASGQSNMAFTVAQSYNATAECAAASAFPNLRVMSVTQGGADSPQPDFGPYGVRLPWARASAQTVCGGDFDYTSAVGYFFARNVHEALGTGAMPVGLIVSSVPGTAIEAWAPPYVLTNCGISVNNSQLWNAMIVPLLGVSIRGAIW